MSNRNIAYVENKKIGFTMIGIFMLYPIRKFLILKTEWK